MKTLISNKNFWGWFSVLFYFGILYWMGASKLYRAHPAVFFVSLVVLTLVLIYSFRLIYSHGKKA
jgi:hypothetical protein